MADDDIPITGAIRDKPFDRAQAGLGARGPPADRHHGRTSTTLASWPAPGEGLARARSRGPTAGDGAEIPSGRGRGGGELDFSLRLDEFMALPQSESVSGRCTASLTVVALRQSLERRRRTGPAGDRAAEARSEVYVIFTSYLTSATPRISGWISSTSRTCSWCTNGKGSKPISREHGGPVRMLVPRLYLWKSRTKGCSRIQFVLLSDHPGFWEVRGYHKQCSTRGFECRALQLRMGSWAIRPRIHCSKLA